MIIIMSPLQISVYLRLSLIYFFTSFLFFLDAFAAATCGRARNDTASFNQSGVGDIFQDEADLRTETQEYDSVCLQMDWLSYGHLIFMLGHLLGSLVGGVLSDRYGRRPVLLVSMCVHAVCGLVPAVLPQPIVFLLVRCLTGVCCCCISMCSFSLAVEWTLPPARLWPPAFLPFCFSIGTMVVALLAWLSSSWLRLHLALSLPQLVCLPLVLSIPESPRWLQVKKRKDVLERYRDNSPEDKQCLELLLSSADQQKPTAPVQKEDPLTGPTLGNIIWLRHRTVLLRLLIMSFISTSSALTYYGICMNMGSFGVDVYSAHFFSGLSETPGLLVPLLRLGRRPISILSLFLSGSACCLSLLLSRYHGGPMLVLVLALLGKLCILAAIFISMLYTIELFPTAVRQRCVSIVGLCFRLGCLVNALVPPTQNGAISLAAMLVYSSGPMIGCALCLLLPETSGSPLPDSVEDCDRQTRATKAPPVGNNCFI